MESGRVSRQLATCIQVIVTVLRALINLRDTFNQYYGRNIHSSLYFSFGRCQHYENGVLRMGSNAFLKTECNNLIINLPSRPLVATNFA